ncbi:MAG TPA: YceI family protein [Candidatus Polarisedimenticolia bacterium]|nr:YceI family protein [Candidatus Polarisedimenticolia bacterium]
MRRRFLASVALLAGCCFSALCSAGTVVPGAEKPPARFAIVPARSTIRFDAKATGHTVHGMTHGLNGEVAFDPEDVSGRASVALRVEAATLDTANRTRDKNMRESHLETAKFPWIEFRSSRIEAVAPTLREGETQELRVQGKLLLHGIERDIAFPVTAVRKGKELFVTGGTVLKLTDYAIPIPKFLFVKMQDQVKVMFEVIASPATP